MNNATISASSGYPNEVSKDAAAKLPVKNLWITKKAVEQPAPNGNFYNYEENSVTWSVETNQNNLNIKNGHLLDTLPIGTDFGKVLKVTRKTSDANISYVATGNDIDSVNRAITFSDGKKIAYSILPGTESGYSKDMVDFTLISDTSDCYIFEYSTVFEDPYRVDKFQCGKTEEIINTAQLTGTYYYGALSKKITANAKASATVNLLLPPLKKSGTYVGNPSNSFPYIDWKIELNPLGNSMGGIVLEDNLQSHMDLDADSLKIYKATTNPNGTMTEGDLIDTMGSAFSEVSVGGFKFTFPNALYHNVPLILKFRTYITDSAAANQMKNEVSLKGSAMDQSNIEDTGVQGAAAFHMDSYAYAQKTPSIKLTKKSSTGNLLAGAVFTLNSVVKNQAGQWAADNSYKKTKTTLANGTAIYAALKTDVVYEIKELSAPLGYQYSAEPKYVVFIQSSPDMEVPVGTEKFTFNSNASSNRLEKDMENTPTGEIVFQKRSPKSSGVPLAGAEFEIKKGSTKLGDTVVSDAGGMVKFTKLDAGTYTIKETKPPRGYTAAADVTAVVTLSASGTYSYELIQGSNQLPKDGSLYYLVNQFSGGEKNSIKIVKVNEKNTGQKLPGAVFELHTASGDDTLKLLDTISTDAAGTAIFTQLEDGNYMILEKTAPTGFQLSTEKYKFTVSNDVTPIELSYQFGNTPIPGGNQNGGGESTGGSDTIQSPSTSPSPTVTAAVSPTPKPLKPEPTKQPKPTNRPVPTEKPAGNQGNKKEVTLRNEEIAGEAPVPQGGTADVLKQPKNGTVAVSKDGKWVYTPNKDYVGEDRFTITITHPDGTVEEIVIDIAVEVPQGGIDTDPFEPSDPPEPLDPEDEIIEGSHPSGDTESLPKTGTTNPDIFYILGIAVVAIGTIFIKKK